MLGYLMLILLLLWTGAVLTGNQFDGFIHLLLMGVLVVLGIRYLSGKKLVD